MRRKAMAEIVLKSGLIIYVDDADMPIVDSFQWHASKWNNNGGHYAHSNAMMHRLIMGVSKNESLVVDHINGNGLDNRRENLRLVTVAQNSMNRAPITNRSSRFKGVSLRKPKTGILRKPWRVQIHVEKNSVTVGYFATEEEAARAYNEAAKKYYGEFAWLNQVDKPAS
jgi:hypothetical protein